MARERNPERDKARRIWLDSGGTLTARQVAEQVGVKPEQVRKWKSLDMWDGIAYKTLGDEAYTDRLMKLNPQYRRTFVFPAGITLTVPEPETRVSSDLPPWKRGTAE